MNYLPIAFTPLTQRQREIVTLMGRGLTDKEIAAKIKISIRTVKSHIKVIYVWCGVHRRAYAVIAAIAYGQIELSDCFDGGGADWVVDAHRSAVMLAAHLKRAIDSREVRR